MVISSPSPPAPDQHRGNRVAVLPLRGALARAYLDLLVDRFRMPEGPTFDPVCLVRGYAEVGDREVAGLLTAVLAYGRVAAIQASVGQVLSCLGDSPSRALAEGQHRHPRFAAGFRYRWTTRRDLIGLLEGMAQMRHADGSLGAGLGRRVRERGGFAAGLAQWVADLRTSAAGSAQPGRSLRFLLADPAGPGASKRLHLYLRWMIRPDDGIDLGTWAGLLPPSELTVPLDTHWARMGPRLGFTRRRVAGRAMAEEITASLRAIDPLDPLRFDFPICHVGIRGHCPPVLTVTHCLDCPLSAVCATGTRRLARRARSRTRAEVESPRGTR